MTVSLAWTHSISSLGPRLALWVEFYLRKISRAQSLCLRGCAEPGVGENTGHPEREIVTDSEVTAMNMSNTWVTGVWQREEVGSVKLAESH